MFTYIIGDVQGCYKELCNLLEHISFNPDEDRLGFVGDLVNRGPQSLETLRFIKNLLHKPLIVLGNHDLHLLALGYGTQNKKSALLNDILTAPDKDELLDWLRHQPLAYYAPEQNYFLVHAGIPPQWNIQQTLSFAKEVEHILQGANFREALSNMYGTLPDTWSESLQKMDRIRYIINALTRMRFCDEHGKLDLTNNSAISTDPDIFKPWFDWYQPPCDIIFGHWAALGGKCDKPYFYALDTGCVWGGKLTALRIEDRKLFSVPCLR